MRKNLDDFLTEYLTIFEVPLTYKGRDTVPLISLGYREAKWPWRANDAFIKEYFQDKPNGAKLLHYILDLAEVAYCAPCDRVLERDHFAKNSTKHNGLQSHCKECMSKHQKEKPEIYKNATAKRRAVKLERTPKWANESIIKSIYDNCPPGHQVDHIVPLQGKNVSGLHVENNLQYLTVEENQIKSNKFRT